MSPLELAERARALAALGDPIRLRTMDMLSAGDLSPDSLVRELRVPGNLLSHHLKVLERAGLIRRVPSQHDRRRIYVQARTGALEGLLTETLPANAARIVFVCTRNSARSVLAEALWRRASSVPCTSAGTLPADQIHPRARKAAARKGLVLAGHGPQAFDDVALDSDLLVSVCDAVNEELVDVPNTRIHWSLPDPAATDTDAAFDRTIADLEPRIHGLATRMTTTAAGARQRRNR